MSIYEQTRDLDVQIETLEFQLRNIQDQLLRLRYRRNTFAPIIRLPDELLVRVIQFLQSPNTILNTYQNLGPLAVDPDWFGVTQVCQRIRSAAIAASYLWAPINSAWNENLVRMCVERAQQSPLCITVYQQEWIGEEDKPQGIKYLHMARQADLFPHENCVDIYQSALNKPAPFLEFLSYHLIQDVFHLTPKFLGGSCNQLVDLRLSQVVLEAAPACPRLRYIKLVSLQTDREFKYLLSLLGNCPVLEKIEIFGVSPILEIATPITPSLVTPIQLPKLRSIDLRATYGVLPIILPVIPDPQHAFSIDVWQEISEPESDAHAKILERLSRFWKSVSGEPHLPFGEIRLSKGPKFDIRLGHECAALQAAPSMYFRALCALDDVKTFLPLFSTLKYYGGRDFSIGEALNMADMKGLTSVSNLVLEGLHANESEVSRVYEWIKARKSSYCTVKHVTLDRCAAHWSSLVDELRANNMVEAVCWNPGYNYFSSDDDSENDSMIW